MTVGKSATAALAALGIIASVTAYLVKGQIPDALILIDTTLVGGYLGLTLPGNQSQG